VASILWPELMQLSLFALAGLACLSLLTWIVLTFFRGAFWQVGRFNGDLASNQQPESWPRVAVVVPARNEAGTIGPCVESLVRQDYAGEFQIIVVPELQPNRLVGPGN